MRFTILSTTLFKKTIGKRKKVLLFDSNLKDRFKDFNLPTSTYAQEATYFLTTCENLIADDGSLLISSNQIAEKRLKELPENFIVFATTSQIVENIGEGLKGIKSKNKKNKYLQTLQP
eukprot:TRINITY_DN43998_c0_g1_i1.p1 TRINITY_DN43998_c0_g1~~TRINITY_DN43998_c0_g1_i1.p1  ORF type:complete len:118 (-),score=8.96 TRINITY_DN43998_c0_g1_i1:19-372(-)